MITLNNNNISNINFLFFAAILNFVSHCFLSYDLLSNSRVQKRDHIYNLHQILCTLSFYYVMHYIVREIGICGSFLENCLYCDSQQIRSALTNEPLSPYNFMKSAPETQSL